MPFLISKYCFGGTKELAYRPASPALLIILISGLALSLSVCKKPVVRTVGDLTIDHPAPLQWTELDRGLGFTRLSFTRNSDQQKVTLAALRIAPALYRFDILSAKKLMGAPLAYLPDLAAKTRPLAAVNASLFRQDNLEPLGLVVARGTQLHAWRKPTSTADSGVFWVKDGRVGVEWAKELKKEWQEDDLAVQAGPIIVEPGKKPGIYRHAQQFRARTAIGIDDQERVIMVCTLRKTEAEEDLSGLDLYELMQIMMLSEPEGGLGLKAALNLDGGTSTAMIIALPKLQLAIASNQPVSNGIAVYPK